MFLRSTWSYSQRGRNQRQSYPHSNRNRNTSTQSQGQRVRAPIEQCSSEFMKEVTKQNEHKEEEDEEEYLWRDQVDFLSCKVDKDIETKPIDIITNTFPIEVSKDINILEYDITSTEPCDYRKTFKR